MARSYHHSRPAETRTGSFFTLHVLHLEPSRALIGPTWHPRCRGPLPAIWVSRDDLPCQLCDLPWYPRPFIARGEGERRLRECIRTDRWETHEVPRLSPTTCHHWPPPTLRSRRVQEDFIKLCLAVIDRLKVEIHRGNIPKQEQRNE